MKIIKVKLGGRSYDIISGPKIINCIGPQILKLKIGKDAYIITNKFIKNKYGRLLERTLAASGVNPYFKCIPDSEQSKSIATLAALLKDISAFDKQRKVFIIAFGGGVVGDLAGFVASVYKRGIPYIQVPTTLLAQVDSSIGGKTAVDLASGKNLVGAFYQPKLVLSDTEFLKSLKPGQLSSGLAEVIKYALIKDKKLFSYLEKNRKKIKAKDRACLSEIVRVCSRIKAEITSQDEYEIKGLRTVLNFGHTVGHAIEAATGYKGYGHGQAVGLGILAAVDISGRLGLLKYTDILRIKKIIRDYGLPVKAKGVNFKRVINAHYRDKKFSGKKNRFVLLRSIGRAKVVTNIPLEVIKKGIKVII